MESEQENRRGILRLAYVAITIRGVYCRERVQAGVKWQMSAGTDFGTGGEMGGFSQSTRSSADVDRLPIA